MKKIILLCLILISFLMGCSKEIIAPPQDNSIKTPETMSHNTLDINKPADWKEIQFGTQLIYIPPGGEVADSLSEKISIVVGFLPKNDNVPLTTIMDNDLRETRKLMPDIEEITNREISSLGPLSGLKTKYSATIQGKKIEITQIDAISITKDFDSDIIYKAGHICLKDKCKYSDIFQEMLKSFKPKEPNKEIIK